MRCQEKKKKVCCGPLKSFCNVSTSRTQTHLPLSTYTGREAWKYLNEKTNLPKCLHSKTFFFTTCLIDKKELFSFIICSVFNLVRRSVFSLVFETALCSDRFPLYECLIWKCFVSAKQWPSLRVLY